MNRTSIPLILTIVVVAMSGAASTRIKIASVPDEYRPTNTMIIEPVSMAGFHFEVNPETSRARLVVDYTYPDAVVLQKNDDKHGPEPTISRIPGLAYDPNKHAVLYEANGERTVCAFVRERKGILGMHVHVANTGRCVVTAVQTKHVQDDGWEILRFSAIDIYFEVR